MKPQKILIVGHMRPAMHYGILQKLMHGFIRLGHQVMVFDDRSIARAATPLRSRKFGIPAMNRQLLQVCKAYQPDMILLGHCEMVWNSTLDQIRHALMEIRIAYRNVDPLMHAQNVADIQRRTTSVDMIFITTAGDALQQFSGKGAGICFMPNPVDPAIDTGISFASTQQPHDAFYAIGGIYKDDPRPGFIDRLQRACPEVIFDVHGMMGRPHIFGTVYEQAMLNARIGLNYSRQNDVYLYSSDRMAQYMGNGLLTCIDQATGFADVLGEGTAVFYGDEVMLADQLRFYKNNDGARQAVAKKGWEMAHGLFSSDRVGQYIIERTFDLPLSREYGWPTTLY